MCSRISQKVQTRFFSLSEFLKLLDFSLLRQGQTTHCSFYKNGRLINSVISIGASGLEGLVFALQRFSPSSSFGFNKRFAINKTVCNKSHLGHSKLLHENWTKSQRFVMELNPLDWSRVKGTETTIYHLLIRRSVLHIYSSENIWGNPYTAGLTFPFKKFICRVNKKRILAIHNTYSWLDGSHGHLHYQFFQFRLSHKIQKFRHKQCRECMYQFSSHARPGVNLHVFGHNRSDFSYSMFTVQITS